MSTEIKKTESNEIQKVKNIQSLLQSDNVKNRLNEILGDKSATFATSVIQIASSNELLKKAEPNSILNAALLATTLELPLNNTLGFAYIVPYYNKSSHQVEAQFQIGYKGFQQLAIRSGQYLDLDAKKVYDGQIVEDNSFRGYHFDWSAKKSDKVIGYASYFELLSGFSSTFYMSIKEIEEHAEKYSQTYKKGFGNWIDNFDKMALKTLIKLLLNSGKAPLSVEMQKAVKADQGVVKNYDGEDVIDIDYVDNKDIEPVTDDDKETQRLKSHLETIKTNEDLETLENSLSFISDTHKELIESKRQELKSLKPKI